MLITDGSSIPKKQIPSFLGLVFETLFSQALF